MKKRLENYKWILMNIPYEEKDLEEIEKKIKKHRSSKFTELICEVAKKIDDENLEEIVKHHMKQSTSNIIIKKLEDMRNFRINSLINLYKEAEEIELFIESLKTKERDLVELIYIKGFQWKEVSEEMNYSERTLKQWNKKILDNLKNSSKSNG